MIAVITGDIVNSRQFKKSSVWLNPLKKLLNSVGKNPKTWEVYRGDSFQIEISEPEDGVLIAIKIKALAKSIDGLDARLSIGIGEKNYSAPRITESNGEAFINSGETLELLKKDKKNLAIKSPWPEFDTEMNLYLSLSLIAMDNWSQVSAELVSILLQNPGMSQDELSKKLNISQPAISKRLKRASYTELMEMEAMYRDKLLKYIR